MKAIKLEAVIDDCYEIHLKLPKGVKAGPAKVIVMFEDDGDALEPSSTSISPPSDSTEPEAVAQGVREFGQFRGLIQIADDFDAPLPDSFWSGEH
ncbi:MAG: hypothetical protein AAGB19_22025 [Cyanobacteria bacterium P01_F01_bin.3]